MTELIICFIQFPIIFFDWCPVDGSYIQQCPMYGSYIHCYYFFFIYRTTPSISFWTALIFWRSILVFFWYPSCYLLRFTNIFTQSFVFLAIVWSILIFIQSFTGRCCCHWLASSHTTLFDSLIFFISLSESKFFF